MRPMRLQKYLAKCGAGSRRSCENLIEEGRVIVNGRKVNEQGVMVNQGDEVLLDGKKISPKPSRYFLLNKPRGIICVRGDQKKRKYVIDLIPNGRELGLFPVGRLDVETRGLIILTNDGDLGNLIAHPRYEVRKTYRATVNGIMKPELIESMESGVIIDNGDMVRGIRIMGFKHVRNGTEVTITIHEGRYHVVRRVFLALGHRVRDLVRTGIGELSLDNISEGDFIEVSRETILDSCGVKEIYQPVEE